jgi:hypothetical protein
VKIVLKDENGREINALEPVFPILTGDTEEKKFECVGTGFFVNSNGLFVTAKHVIEDKEGVLLNPFFAIQTVDGRHFTRYRKCLVRHPTADIAFGCFSDRFYERKNYYEQKILGKAYRMSLDKIKVTDKFLTFAFPESKVVEEADGEYGLFDGTWEQGEVIEYLPNGNGMHLKDECYRTNHKLPGGSSGGPVIKNGVAVGVNSTAFPSEPGKIEVSYITPIRKLLEIDFPVDQVKLG